MTARLYSMLIISAGGEISAYIERYFSAREYQVQIISDAEYRLKWRKIRLPDLILFDKLTLEDNLGFVRFLRSTPQLDPIDFIIISEEPDPHPLGSLNLAYDDWIHVEPFDLEEIRLCVNNRISMKQRLDRQRSADNQLKTKSD
jgi:DNA-binding response OmpR family regulator